MRLPTRSLLFLLGALSLVAADSATGQCGPSGGGLTCNTVGTTNKCCSNMGWCGDSSAHCGTGCQSQFGTCSSSSGSNPPPSTGSRPKPGNVPYGAGIYACTKPGVVALTFDDGPYLYTSELLDLLSSEGAKATFFLTGDNKDKGAIDTVQTWRNVILRMYNDGHQIASHTWNHPDLSTLSTSNIKSNMLRLESALTSILGRYPTYMRPPYSSCNDACLGVMNELGYHVVYFNVDSDDYNNLGEGQIVNSRNKVTQAYQNVKGQGRGALTIAHDIHAQTVRSLTKWMIEEARRQGFTQFVTVGECLGDPSANWYRSG